MVSVQDVNNNTSLSYTNGTCASDICYLISHYPPHLVGQRILALSIKYSCNQISNYTNKQAETIKVQNKVFEIDENTKTRMVKLYSMLNKKSKEAWEFYDSNRDLHDKIANPYWEKKLGKPCMKDSNENIFGQEGLDYKQFAKKPITSLPIYTKENERKIPLNLQMVWFTSSKYTEPERLEKFYKHNKYLEENLKKTQHWNKYLWTNDLMLIPDSVKQYLKDKNITLALMDTLEVFNDESSKFHDLFLASKIFAEEREFGMSTSIMRSLMLWEKGGAYIDGDYKLFNVSGIERLMGYYDSFFAVEREYDARLGNGFLAAVPRNIVIEGALNLTHRNIFLYAILSTPLITGLFGTAAKSPAPNT